MTSFSPMMLDGGSGAALGWALGSMTGGRTGRMASRGKFIMPNKVSKSNSYN